MLFYVFWLYSVHIFIPKWPAFFCFFFSAPKAAILPNEIISHRELPPLHSRSTSKKEFKLSNGFRSPLQIRVAKEEEKKTNTRYCLCLLPEGQCYSRNSTATPLTSFPLPNSKRNEHYYCRCTRSRVRFCLFRTIFGIAIYHHRVQANKMTQTATKKHTHSPTSLFYTVKVCLCVQLKRTREQRGWLV